MVESGSAVRGRWVLAFVVAGVLLSTPAVAQPMGQNIWLMRACSTQQYVSADQSLGATTPLVANYGGPQSTLDLIRQTPQQMEVDWGRVYQWR